MRVWVEEDLDKEAPEFTLKGILQDKDLNPGLRADALRYEILNKYGGIYVDTDMALVKPIHELLNSMNSDFFICISYSEAFEVNNAIVGSAPGHPFLQKAIDKLNKTFNAQKSQK